MSSGLIIRSANADELIDLRWELLRAGLARETAVFEGDEEVGTRHFVVEMDAKVVGCATFLRRPLEDQAAWQLRGMAVRSDLQRGGVGRAMLEFAERFLREEGYTNLLWCNARVPAKAFYERLGWQTISEQFDIPSAGPHVKMTKNLSPQMKTDEHR